MNSFGFKGLYKYRIPKNGVSIWDEWADENILSMDLSGVLPTAAVERLIKLRNLTD